MEVENRHDKDSGLGRLDGLEETLNALGFVYLFNIQLCQVI